MQPALTQHSHKGSGLRTISPKNRFPFFHQKVILSHLYFFFSFQPPGHQEAIAVCLHLQTQQTVNETLCDVVHRPPAMSQACNTEPCPPRYVLPCAPGTHCVRKGTPQITHMCRDLTPGEQPGQHQSILLSAHLRPQPDSSFNVQLLLC